MCVGSCVPDNQCGSEFAEFAFCTLLWGDDDVVVEQWTEEGDAGLEPKLIIHLPRFTQK